MEVMQIEQIKPVSSSKDGKVVFYFGWHLSLDGGHIRRKGRWAYGRNRV